MNAVLEVSEEGTLTVPSEVLRNAEPHTHYTVEVQGEALLLRPMEDKQPFWATATPEEWVKSFREWADRERPPAPDIPDEALRRENIYD